MTRHGSIPGASFISDCSWFPGCSRLFWRAFPTSGPITAGERFFSGWPADSDGALFGWRIGFTWLVQLPILVERVYVLGTGERAQRLVQGLRQNPEIGVEIASWTGKMEGAVTRDSVAAHLMDVVRKQKVHRVIVAMPDRRGTIPMQELLDLRMQGVKIEEAASWLERISGKIEVENLYPSWLVFGEGFRRSNVFSLVRRVISVVISLVGLHLCFASDAADRAGHQARFQRPGVLYPDPGRQGRPDLQSCKVPHHAARRRGRRRAVGDDNDPRVTRVGKFLRFSRLDEIPQLWCVLKGDMAFVGPRPERPEFVEWLSRRFPTTAYATWCVPGSRAGRRSNTNTAIPLKTPARSCNTIFFT